MVNEKFIWKQDDVEFVEESDFNKVASLYSSKAAPPFPVCELNSSCPFCDEEDQEIAKLLAVKIYNSYFNNKSKNVTLIDKVLKNYISLCKKLLPENIILTKQLYCCAKMCLINIFLSSQVFSEEEIRDIIKSIQ